MNTWKTVLIVVVVAVAVVVALMVRGRRWRTPSDTMGLPPLGALTEPGPGQEQTGSTEAREPAPGAGEAPRRAAR